MTNKLAIIGGSGLYDVEEFKDRELLDLSSDQVSEINQHSLKNYHSIQFTCRHLINFKNPFVGEFNKLRKFAKETDPDGEITSKINSLDLSTVSKNIRFFYPFEVQVVDEENYKINTEGEASHQKYISKITS